MSSKDPQMARLSKGFTGIAGGISSHPISHSQAIQLGLEAARCPTGESLMFT